MKKLNVLTAFLFCLFFVTAIHANDSFIDNNDYKIEEISQPAPAADVAKVWKLTYNEGAKPITVSKRIIQDGSVFVVQSDYFEVCYASTPKGFGTRSMKKAWCCVPSELTQVVLNPDEIKKQQVILPNSVDDATALGLIASYLPNILNENYKHLLN